VPVVFIAVGVLILLTSATTHALREVLCPPGRR
jgi:hypothetical protein